jgi:hypothetical protein
VLRVVLHLYYGLAYIKLAWGGAEEQAAKRAAGNRNAKNWQDEARTVVEMEVIAISYQSWFSFTDKFQMEKYWTNCPQSMPITTLSTPTNDTDSIIASMSIISDFDQYCWTLVAVEEDEGWQAELQWYLKDMPANVTVETNIIHWWQVHQFNSIPSISYLRSHIKCRTITGFIPPLNIWHLTFSLSLHLPFLGSVSFPLPKKLWMIVMHAWVPRGLRNSRS